MKKEIYLIRHGEQLKIKGVKKISYDTQSENEKIILSVEGEKGAEEISKLKELQNIDVVWSSNYVRALSTAKYIVKENDLEINIDENFGERKLGNLKKLKEMGEQKSFPYTEEQLLDENLKNEDGENCIEVRKRFMESLDKIIANKSEKRVVVVSHGAAIKFVLKQWCDLNKKNKLEFEGKIIEVKSPGIVKLVFEGNKLESIAII